MYQCMISAGLIGDQVVAEIQITFPDDSLDTDRQNFIQSIQNYFVPYIILVDFRLVNHCLRRPHSIRY